MSKVSFNGFTISAATGGRSVDDAESVVVLVHGAAMDRTAWSLQTRWLAHHGCPTVAVDLPGHGASSDDPLGSIEDYADWAADLVKAIARPVHMVGHSMGSFITLECASRVELASILLLGTAAVMPVHPALLEAAEANDPLAAQLMSGWAYAHSTRTAPHPSPGSSMVGATQAMVGQAKPGVLHADLAMCAAYENAVAAASAVEAPASLLLGAADRMTPVRAAQPLLEAMPDASVTIVPGVGHMVQIEAPAATRSAIAELVASTNG